MRKEHTEAWYSKSWRPAAAFVYLAICVIDFSLMPMYVEWVNHSVALADVVKMSLTFPDPMAAFKLIQSSRTWSPLTLSNNGLFHAAFGAVLGVAAWQRGKEKVAQILANQVVEPQASSAETTEENDAKSS